MWKNQDLESPRVLCAAALTLTTTVAAVLAVREIAVRVLLPNPAFLPLTVAPPIVDTILCTLVAIFCFHKIMVGPNPIRTLRRIATIVLVLSFTPNVLLATSCDMGGGWREVALS